MASRSTASFLSGENLIAMAILVVVPASGGRWDSVLIWFCSGDEVDSSLVLAASVEIEEPAVTV